MQRRLNRRDMIGAAVCATAGSSIFAGAAEKNKSKKGIGLDLRMHPDWREMLKTLNVDWFYSWGASVPLEIPRGMEFVPMIWSRWSCTSDTLNILKEKGYETLIGFNNPDQYNQANLSVEDALNLWPILMESGMRLGSPACVLPDDEWMSLFMNGIKKKGFRVDFISVHLFTNNNADYFLRRIEEVYSIYQKPLWITEFGVVDWEACADRPNTYSMDDVLRFMEKVIPELERRDYVERYAWYSSPFFDRSMDSTALFNRDGSLNPLGQLYASY